MRFRPLSICLALVVAAFLAGPVAAQMARQFPANARLAELTATQHPFVILNGENRRLAPGALIYDTHNRTILYGFLPQTAAVAYTQDQNGLLMRIYLLTPAELERQQELERQRQRR